MACAATGCCLAPATSLVVASPSETSTLVLVALMVPLLFATVLVAVACGAITPVDWSTFVVSAIPSAAAAVVVQP